MRTYTANDRVFNLKGVTESLPTCFMDVRWTWRAIWTMVKRCMSCFRTSEGGYRSSAGPRPPSAAFDSTVLPALCSTAQSGANFAATSKTLRTTHIELVRCHLKYNELNIGPDLEAPTWEGCLIIVSHWTTRGRLNADEPVTPWGGKTTDERTKH